MLNYEFPPIGGGAAGANLCLLKEYQKNSDLTVDLLTSAPKPGFFEEKLSEKITIYKVGLHKKDLHFWRRAEVIEWLIKARGHYGRLLKRNSYDLAHAFFGFPTGYLCRRTAGELPYVISLRGSDVPGANVRLKVDYKILGPLFKRIWKSADLLVACSEGLKARALDFLPGVSIDVIPNGVDPDRFYPAETSDKAGTLRLLTVGRLSATKRVEMLIDAVEILHKDKSDVHLTIVGGGSLQQQLRQTVSQKNLSDVIEITGRAEPGKMPELYRQSGIFVSATMQEGMSNAMLEAMASGLPIVTTQCEGVEELVDDNGIVVEHNSAEALAESVRIIASDEQAYANMSAAARRRAERFSWGAAADRYLSLYQQICAKDKAIKVCFVCPKAYPLFDPGVNGVFGGAEVDLYTLACELAKDPDYDVSFITADYGQADAETIRGVRIYKSIDFRKSSLAGARQIWRAMKQVDADIYFQETAGPGTFLVAYFCRCHGRKFVYRTAHQREVNGTYVMTHPVAGKCFCWALKNAAQVIVQNDEDHEQLLAHTGVESEVIRNAHELSLLGHDNRDMILWTGRSAAFKRPRLFLELARRTTDEQFVMICQHATYDTDYDSLKEEAAGIPNLEFIEHVPFREVGAFFGRAKMYVNTSDSEGFANTYVDACKAGTPVLSLRVNPDNFINENNCGFCAGGDWGRFLELFDKLRTDTETACKLGLNGRKYVEQNHDIAHTVKVYKNLFAGIANR